MREVVVADARTAISNGYVGLNFECTIVNHSTTPMLVRTGTGRLKGRVPPTPPPKAPAGIGPHNIPYCPITRLARYGEHILVIVRICNGSRLVRSSSNSDTSSVALYSIPIGSFAQGSIYVEEADILLSCDVHGNDVDVGLEDLLNRPIYSSGDQSMSATFYGEHNVRYLADRKCLYWHGGLGMIYEIPLLYRPAMEEGVIRVSTPFSPTDDRARSRWVTEYDWSQLVNDCDGGVMTLVEQTQSCCAVDRTILEGYVSRTFGVKLMGTPVDPAVLEKQKSDDDFIRMRVAAETSHLMAENCKLRKENESVDKNVSDLKEYIEHRLKGSKQSAQMQALFSKYLEAGTSKAAFDKLKSRLSTISMIGATYMAVREPARVLIAYLIKVMPKVMMLLKFAP